MPKMSIGQKCQRGVQFLTAMTKPTVAEALVRIGFTDADREEGYARIAHLTAGALRKVGPDASDPRVVERLDAWENRWFPTCEATLQHRYPAMHAHVFANLRQTAGPEVVVSVATMIDRLDSAKSEGIEGADEALALLAQRGLDEAQLASARSILGELRVAPKLPPPDPISPEELAAREDSMWSWYLEWSKIARASIHNRNVLRALGFLEPTTATVEASVGDEDDENGEDGEDGGGEGSV